MHSLTLSDAQVTFVAIVAAWALVWKGFALWRAAVRHDKVWFIVLLVLNTAGFVDILYLFVFSKREDLAKKQ